jgi:hypothetical protein
MELTPGRSLEKRWGRGLNTIEKMKGWQGWRNEKRARPEGSPFLPSLISAKKIYRTIETFADALIAPEESRTT